MVTTTTTTTTPAAPAAVRVGFRVVSVVAGVRTYAVELRRGSTAVTVGRVEGARSCWTAYGIGRLTTSGVRTTRTQAVAWLLGPVDMVAELDAALASGLAYYSLPDGPVGEHAAPTPRARRVPAQRRRREPAPTCPVCGWPVVGEECSRPELHWTPASLAAEAEARRSRPRRPWGYQG